MNKYLEFKKNNPGKSIIDTSRKDFSPSYKVIEKELKTGRHLFTVLNPKYGPEFFSQETLQDLLQTVAKWHTDHFEGQKKKFEFGDRNTGLIYDRNDPNTYRVLYCYQKAIKSIHTYAEKKGIVLNSPTIDGIFLSEALRKKDPSDPDKRIVPKELIMKYYDRKYWGKETTKAYHVIYHLCKYLGFDPMTFTPLDDNIFKGGEKAGGWARHHFLALMFRKMSSHANDIVLTSDTLHHKEYESFLKKNGLSAEIYVKLLMQSLAELVNKKDQNGYYIKIKEDHIREALYKNFGEVEGEKILEKWKSAPNFIRRLSDFNVRRLDAFKGDYKNFLIQKYGNAYSAYFKKVKGITFTSILATQSNLDFLTSIYGLSFTLNPVQTKI